MMLFLAIYGTILFAVVIIVGARAAYYEDELLVGIMAGFVTLVGGIFLGAGLLCLIAAWAAVFS